MYDEHLRPAGVRIGQYSILAALYYVQSMPLLKLAARLELDRTTLTRSVARLDRDGLISIELGSSDNRVRAISITEAEFAGHQTQPMLPGMKQRAFG
jgi:DNA-binding MarR family transcriptional regulator